MMYQNPTFKQLTHNLDDDENLVVGFRGSAVKDKLANKRLSYEIFEPMHLNNVKLSKKYFAKQHKNQSNFNVYKDFIRNLSEFEKNKLDTTSGKNI